MTLTPATALNLVAGLILARTYNTTTDRISFQVNLSVAANLDTALSYVRFGDVADANYFQALASTWGTLANGWNLVRIARSDFTTTGAPNWNSIAKVTFFVDAVAGQNVTAIFDDVYVMYNAASTMPAGQVCASWKNIVVTGRPDANPSDLNYSKVSAPDEYDANAVLPVDANDGAVVTGLHPYYDQLIVTKDNTVLSLAVRLEGTTYPSYTFGLKRITIEHGCSSHRSLVEAAGRVFMWWRSGIFEFVGIGTRKISYRVDPTLGDIESSRFYQVTGANRRDLNQVFYWWPASGATQNTRHIRYDYQEDAFLQGANQTMALVERVFDAGVEYLLTAGYTGRILRQDSGTSFDGTAITAFVTTPWVSGGKPDEVKSWLELLFQYQTQTSGSVTVEYRLADHTRQFDAATYVTAVTVDQSVSGEFGRVFIGDQSRWIQVRFRTVGALNTTYWPVIIKAVPTGALL
jgi:hypothetical protein